MTVHYDEKYRWPNWPEFLRREGSTAFIGYGTLINKASASRSMGRAGEGQPVTAFGVRRVFSFVLEDENYVDHGGLYRRSDYENHVATLNIQETGEDADIVNGVLMRVSGNQIDGLAGREAGYDIIPVAYSLVADPEHQLNAYIFTARKESSVIGHRVRDDVLPNESSLEICLSGARDYGEGFLDTWIRHCYLADGSRLLNNDYYRDLIETII
jgi:hypothetical protein